MYKIGVIGTKESVLCFMATGFEVRIADNAQAALSHLKELANSDCAIIYITEDYASQLSEETDKYKDKSIPAIITVPGAKGRMGYGMDTLRKACERAVGMNILK